MKLTEFAKIKTFWGRDVIPAPEMTEEQKNATLLRVLQREQGRYVDKLVSAANVRLDIRRPKEDAKPEFCIVFEDKLEGVGSYEYVAFLTDACHDQLAEKVGLPTKYYQKCGTFFGREKDLSAYEPSAANHPLVWNANFWLSTLGNQGMTVRMWKNDDGLLLCRALLSDRYKFIDNYTVALHSIKTAADALQRQGLRPPECFGWNITERGLDLMLFSTEMVANLEDPDPDADVTMGKWGEHKLSSAAAAAFRAWREKGTKSTAQSTEFDPKNDGSGGLRMATAQGHDRSNGGAPTGLVFGAIRIRNSETGDGSCQVRGLVMVTACQNQLMGGFDTFQIHLGSQKNVDLVLRKETIEKENELVIAKLVDTATSMFTKERFQKIVDSIRATQKIAIVSPITAVQKIAEKIDVLKGLEESILAQYIRHNGKSDTLYDMAQAVTSVASQIREIHPQKAWDIENAVSQWWETAPKQILAAATK